MNFIRDANIPWVSIGPVLAVFCLWFIGLFIYAIRTIFKGRYHCARVAQMGGTRLLGVWLMEYGYWVFEGIGNFFIRIKIGPDFLTALSLLISVASAAALYKGWFGLGGWLMVAAALFDVFDGMVARATGVASDAGEYFDSIVDRYCELVTFVAVMGYYFPFQPLVAMVVGLAMIASVMITFNRAKGEAHGVTGVPSGLMRRHERLLYIGVGTAASPIAAIWLEPGASRPVYHAAIAAYTLVAVLGNITAIHLALQVHRRLKGQVSSPNHQESITASTVGYHDKEENSRVPSSTCH